MTQETPSEFSLQVRRGAGASAMVLAIAVLMVAVALAVYWLRAPVSSMGQRSMPPPGELPIAVSGSATSRVISTPLLPAGASLVRMTRTPP